MTPMRAMEMYRALPEGFDEAPAKGKGKHFRSFNQDSCCILSFFLLTVSGNRVQVHKQIGPAVRN